MAKPTPKNEQVQVGDSCESVFAKPDQGMQGVVQRIVRTASIDYALVKWSSGSTGRHTITTLRKVTSG